jgi:hypothetical protein
MRATVASYTDPIEAQIVRALLESEGLDATVADAHTVSVDWQLAQAVGVRVQVPHAQLEAAQRLVAAYHAGELAPEPSDDEDRCGICGGTDLDSVVPASQKALALAIFALAAAPISARTQRVCRTCGAVETAD